MKTKSLLNSLLILFGLLAISGGSYALARLLPLPLLPAAPQAFSLKTSEPVFSTSWYGAAAPIPFSNKDVPTVKVYGRIRSFALSPDGRNIALATSQGIVLYDLDGKRQTRVLNESENFFSVDWSPDGKKLAAGSIVMRAVESGLPHVIVWDKDNWNILFERKSETEASIPFGDVAWSPDGRSLAFSIPERGLTAVDIETGDVISEQEDMIVPPYDIEWSPDGTRLIATGDLAYGFRRWRVDTGETIHLYDPRAGAAPIYLAWLPDGKRIVSGHADGTVCFWTASTNQCDGLIYAHRYTLSALALSADGNQLATGSNVIRIWDTGAGVLLTSFGLKDGIRYERLDWLDSKTVISLETDMADSVSIVRFWDVETGTVTFEVRGNGYEE